MQSSATRNIQRNANWLMTHRIKNSLTMKDCTTWRTVNNEALTSTRNYRIHLDLDHTVCMYVRYDSFTSVYYVKKHWYTAVSPRRIDYAQNTGIRFHFHSEFCQHNTNCMEHWPCLIQQAIHTYVFLYRSTVKQYHNKTHSTDLL